MHTAHSLRRELFDVRIDGRAASRADLLPDWHPHDRLAIVVHEAHGALGASLLLQLSITAFYDALPARRGEGRVYPEVFVLHVGGRFGDHSSLDVWPARKEMFLPADPAQVLDAIHNCAITRLAVPDGPQVQSEYFWREAATAAERLRSCFVYDAGGRVHDADVEIRALSPAVSDDVISVLTPQSVLAGRVNIAQIADPQERVAYEVYLDHVRARMEETSAQLRGQLLARRAELLSRGGVVETFRRVDSRHALARLRP